MADKLATISRLVHRATCALVPDRSHASDDAELLHTPEYWEQLRLVVDGPLAREMEAKDAAEEGDAARQAQLAVDTAEALAKRPCAHPCCTTMVGPREAETPRGQSCSGCLRVRYCGPACQKADWRAHKAACRELQRRRTDAAQ